MQRTLGDAIKYFRVLSGLTQEQLAVMIGADQNTVSRLERNVSNPSISRISQLVVALGITESELFRFTEVVALRDAPERYDPAVLLREFQALTPTQQELLRRLMRELAG